MNSPGKGLLPLRTSAEVIENRPLNEKHYLMTFRLMTFSRPEAIEEEPQPGQFFMLSSGKSYDPLLKRPFSFFRRTRAGIQVLYRVVGKGTALLSGIKSGGLIEALGPLGNSYPAPRKGLTPVVVAGGVGIASVMPLIEKIGRDAIVLYGGKRREELLLLDEIAALSGDLRTSTEDGSFGKKGLVTDLLKDISEKNCVLYACGPRGMLMAVADMAFRNGLNGYLSFEERMACGVGACLGCVVKTAKGYRRVCKEGPVFKMEDVIF